ncbi:unnamed protein product [Hydatigera taeniaeformis]|uniref:Protoporphyrinogen oxidase n=1 Tax=Hydatigena taeniaeformis TaxID=6205 RepID=A0A0R3WHW1_HYDTA|nr:unnamed protein product [Hydatigera taeniaeformis]
MARCAVIGGGLSGLSTAYLLSRLPQNQVGYITVYEKNAKQFGGCFLTGQNPNTGALHDLGPHSARVAVPSSSPLLRLISSLGFTRNEIFWLPPLKRYIYAAGALRPINLFSIKTESPFTRSHLALFIRRALTRGPGPLIDDVSVDEYLRTRFDDEFADFLGSALMRGVCGVDSKLVSASAFLSYLIRCEKEAPNVIIGAVKNMTMGKMRSLYPNKANDVSLHALDSLLSPVSKDIVQSSNTSVFNFAGGMQMLTDRLVKALSEQPNVTLLKGSCVRALRRRDNRYFQLDLVKNGFTSPYKVESDAVFICTPAQQMGLILETEPFIPLTVTKLLSPQVFPSASIGVVALEFEISNTELPRGFGHLLPLTEDETVMGVVYDSLASPLMDGKIIKNETQRTTRFTIMLAPRTSWLEATSGKTSFNLERELREKMIKIGVSALRRHLNLQLKEPCFAHVGIWNNTIPTYPVGHLKNVQAIRSAIKDRLGSESSETLHLVGSALDGVGVSDCVASAVKAVCNFSKRFTT